jgi:hypothetical protein
MSDTTTLVRALRVLARDIHCDDGIATQCIAEAADAIERLRLTDEEREAIAESIWHWLRQADALLAVEREARIAASSRAATLQGLRERLEGRRE